MQSEIQYIKDDKIYRMSKQAWKPRKVRMWLLLPLLAMLVLGGYAVLMGFGAEVVGVEKYTVDAEADYMVYLKDNDYYAEKFLPSGMQYVANLISVMLVELDYKFETEDDLQVEYGYEIVALAKAAERDDEAKVLYEETQVLKTRELSTAEDGRIEISEKVNLDYQKYYNYMNDFRSDLGVAAKCFLELKMIVTLSGDVKAEDEIVLEIPISGQTISVTTNAGKIGREVKVGKEETEIFVRNWSLIIVGSVIIVISLVLIVAIIYYHATRYNENLYEKALRKILKEYDTLIVEGSETIYEQLNVVRVESFKELLDAQGLEQAPITFLEVIPGEKAYFIVNCMNGTTYRYTLSKAYQDKLAAEGESEF